MVQLIELVPGRGSRRLRVVVEHLPARERTADAGRAGIAPDRAIFVELIQQVPGGSSGSLQVVVEQLPAGTGSAAAGGAGVTPDRVIGAQLKQLAADGCDRGRPRVVLRKRVAEL